MTAANNLPTEASQRLRTVNLIWAAFIASVGIYFVLISFLPATPEGDDLTDTTTIWLYIAAGAFVVLASFIIKSLFLRSAIQKRSSQMAQTAYIVALAFCEMAGVFSITSYFVANSRLSYILLALALLGILLHKPQRKHFQFRS